MNKPTPQALKEMQARGGTWAAYQNAALDSADLGHMRFLRHGPECTLKTPPQRYPDTQQGIGWRYAYVGTVNLETFHRQEGSTMVKSERRRLGQVRTTPTQI